MFHPGAIRLRRLPDGEFQDGREAGWNERLLEIDVPGEGFFPGALLEIECGPMLYLGELQQRRGSIHRVAVEHALDRARLASILQESKNPAGDGA